MPRKPNYRFERAERDRAKAAKKAAKLEAKRRAAAGEGDTEPGTDAANDDEREPRAGE